MSVLDNNNRRVCLRLARRMIRASRVRSVFLCLSILLVTMLYTIVFYTADSVHSSYLLQDQTEYGSTSHIVFTGLSRHQAERISGHDAVESSVELHSVGTLGDELLEYRNIYLAAADEDFAQTVSAVPEEGHMPRKEGEIALDTMTLDSLGLPHRTGTSAELTWLDVEGQEHQTQFTICGFWSGENIHTESCAWISPDEAEKLRQEAGTGEKITLGVMLWHPEDLNAQAEEIIADLGLGEVAFSTNLSYNSARMDTADARAVSYLITALFVVAGGFLLIYNIMAVSLHDRLALLSSMKALGMTPRQAGLFTSLYGLLLCIPSVPAGLLPGFATFYYLAPGIIEGYTGIRLEPGMLHVWPAVAAVLGAVLTAWAGCFFSTCRMNGWMPARIQAFLNREYRGKKKRKRERVTAWSMARRTLTTGKRSFGAAVCTLLIASLLLGSSYIRYISYDEDYYAEEMYISDYSFIDASCDGDYQRYNEKAGNITEEMADEIRSCPEVEEYGEFLTREVDLTADETLRRTVVDFYNEIDTYYGNMTRRESMSGQPGWVEGLDTLEETGNYRSVLIGAEGLVMDYVLFYGVLDGTFDPQAFATGNYVLSVGATSDEGISSAPAGSKVEIGGRTFTVMAAIEDWGIVPAGRNSRAAEFSLNYVMPADTLRELYPGTNIRQIMVNLKEDGASRFEEATAGIREDEGVSVHRRSDEVEEFRQSAASAVSVGMFSGILLLGISMLGFVNVIMTKVLTRGREFALYQSLGMERGQIRKMVLYEGLIQVAVSLLVTLPLAAVGLWYGMEFYYNSNFAYISNNDWAVIYEYSPLPLFVIAFVVLLLFLALPQIFLGMTEKKSVMERMRYRE